MDVIIFFGHHKVGSSALQTYLAQNAVALMRRGILYPAVETQGLVELLGIAAAGLDRPEGDLPVNYREAHNALAFAMMAEHNPARHKVPDLHRHLPPVADMLRTIRRQIRVLAPQTVILASEVMANFGAAAPELIDRLREAFPGARLHLTATLRRVDDYMISWHAQRLRFGQKPRSLPEGAFGHYAQSIHFNYRQMVEPWLKRMPEATFRLRSYDAVLAAGGAVQDFLAGHGIAPVPGAPVEPRVNTGLHRGLIEIARQANHSLPGEEAHDVFRGLLDLGGRLGLPRSADIEMYGPALRTRLHDQFAPIADWLDSLADVPLFPDRDDLARPRPVHEHAANMAALAALRADHAGAFRPAGQAFLAALEPRPNYPLFESV